MIMARTTTSPSLGIFYGRIISALRQRFVLAVGLAAIFFNADVHACTSFCISSPGRVMVGRSFDWDFGDGLIIVNKRDQFKTALIYSGENASSLATWKSKYGSVTFNQYGRDIALSGMNEAGLVISVLWLAETKYPSVDSRRSISADQYVQYILDNFRTIDEIIASDSSIRLRPTLNDFTKIHFFVTDCAGNGATIEFLNGKMVYHAGADLPVNAITNNTYSNSIAYLSQGIIPSQSDNSSLARFQRAATLMKEYNGTGLESAVDYSFRVLDAVRQGIYTKIQIVFDVKNRLVYFKSKDNSNLRLLKLKSFDFSCATPSRVLDLNAPYSGDVTDQFIDYTWQLNEAMIEKAWRDLGYLYIETAALRMISRYPETFVCAEKTDEIFLFVPIVLAGKSESGTPLTSELTLTNRGSKDATILLNYTASIGTGSGSASALLPAGQQRIIPDAAAVLKSLGLPLPDASDLGGSLWARFSGISSPSDIAMTVRTTAPVPGARTGLAYAGIPESLGLNGTSYLCGLRQSSEERSDLALQNMATAPGDSITLRITLHDGASDFSWTIPDLSLTPGEFRLIAGILSRDGSALSNGYARVERIGGSAPYYAYAIIHDGMSFDESLIRPAIDPEETPGGLILPVIVQTGDYASELVATNWSAETRVVRLEFAGDWISTPTQTAIFFLSVEAGRQIIIPNLVQYWRDQKAAGIDAPESFYRGAVFASVDGGACRSLFLGTRVSLTHRRIFNRDPGYFDMQFPGELASAADRSVHHGAFYSAVPFGKASTATTWIYGLQQDGTQESSLALINTGEVDSSGSSYAIDVYDGATGQKAATSEDINIKARGWIHLERVLEQIAPGVTQGYVRVRQTAGINPFFAYGGMTGGCPY